jgi:hypothetical protein
MSKLLLSTLMAGCVVLAAPFAEAKFPYDVQIRNHHHVASLTAQQWLDLCSTRLSAQWQNESNAVFNRPAIYRFRIDTTGTITDLKLDNRLEIQPLINLPNWHFYLSSRCHNL